MKILLTGGGTGGHFYPTIAVAQAIREMAAERKILSPNLYYAAPNKYNPRALFDNEIEFIGVPAGKVRRYFSLLNITDAIKTFVGCIKALFSMYSLYPDVIFGKGGYASFPILFVAKVLRIPVVIHESDSKPGRVNIWAGKFARKIALSYPDAAKYFKVKDQSKIAYTGNPIRKEIREPLTNGAREFLGLEDDTPVVLILGGSQGAQVINDAVLGGLPEILEKFEVIHQTGKNNLEEIKQTTSVILNDHEHKNRYHPFDYLNELALRMSAGVANVVVSRAGSTIFEIASWGVPSIIIPLPQSVSHDQTTNAFAYVKTGAGSIIEQDNLSAHILLGEINRIYDSPKISELMRERAKAFARLDSANIIANALLDIALEHEK